MFKFCVHISTVFSCLVAYVVYVASYSTEQLLFYILAMLVRSYGEVCMYDVLVCPQIVTHMYTILMFVIYCKLFEAEKFRGSIGNHETFLVK